MPVSYTKLLFSLLVFVMGVCWTVTWARAKPGRTWLAMGLLFVLVLLAIALWVTLEIVCDRLGLWWL